MRARIEQELALLRERYPDVEHVEHANEDWFRLPDYAFPPGWRIAGESVQAAVIFFKVNAGYPAAEPYAFAAPAPIDFQGAAPQNVSPAAGSPFGGEWTQFSWAPDGAWAPSADSSKGSNLVIWARSFAQRLAQGACALSSSFRRASSST